ncbi:hypothetical protein KJ785_02500 [Patescibacteria group bacterium]|nr:hypothetical protein [Patescibacteria group bacterium]
MVRETRGGGESQGGEVDFDSILASVVEEVGVEAEGKVVKAEKRKKSKTSQAEISGELGSHLQGLAKKEGGESEEELTATAFNFLIYSEFGNKKIPETVQAKLDVYTQAKEKHASAVKKMEKLPDNLQGDPRLIKALDDLKSKMVAEARELASELGVNYEEIAKGETALLATEDAEIVRLREEADKLSPGKVEFAKESYEDYKERVASVLVERMVATFRSSLDSLLVKNGKKKNEGGIWDVRYEFEQEVPYEDRETIEKDESSLVKGLHFLAEKELGGFFQKIETEESDEGKRRIMIARLERVFGGIADGSSNYVSSGKEGTTLSIRSGGTKEELGNEKEMPAWVIDMAYIEAKLLFVMRSFCSSESRERDVSHPDVNTYNTMSYLRNAQEKPSKFESWNFRTMGGGIDYAMENKEEIDIKSTNDPTLSRLSAQAGAIWEQVDNPELFFGRDGVAYLGETSPSLLFRRYKDVKDGRSDLTREQLRELAEWKSQLEVHMAGHKPTNLDVVNKATGVDGVVKADSPKVLQALVGTLQEQLREALQVASTKATEVQSTKYEKNDTDRKVTTLESERQRLEQRLQSLEEQLHGGRKELAQKAEEAGGMIREFREERGQLENQLRNLKSKIQNLLELSRAGQQEGLPVMGKTAEIARRQEILDGLEKLTE